MRLRPGRKNPRNIYLQFGADPDDQVDLPLGLMIDTDVAALIGEGLTSPWHLNEIRLIAQARTDEPRNDHEGAGSQGKHRSGGTETEVPELSDGQVPPASCVEPWCLP